MKVKCEKSLETLDVKVTVDFLHDNPKLFTDSIATQHKLGNKYRIWTIEDFLSIDECNEIINSCNKIGFESLKESYDINYRDSERILAFDKNNYLIDTIEKRLNNDEFLKRLQNNKVKPYGFNTDNYEWSNNNNINRCLRINKYEPNSNGFDWHRDAQFTENENIKSNYTLLIYLTNNTDGSINFIAPKDDFIHNGYTSIEELDILNKINCDTFQILPKVGMAVIFDQRLLHKAVSNTEIKYVLRTDLVAYGTKLNDTETELELKIKNLTKQLFRQAQYFELELNNTKAKDLYEICLSLRQTPNKIINYPEHLEKLLVQIPINKQIVDNDIFSIELLSRSGSKYEYKYNNTESFQDIYNGIKIASAYTMTSSIMSINDICIEDESEFMEELLKTIDLDKKVIKMYLDDKIKINPIKKHKSFKRYFYKENGCELDLKDPYFFSDHNLDGEFDKYLKSKYNIDNLNVKAAKPLDDIHSGLIIKCSCKDITTCIDHCWFDCCSKDDNKYFIFCDENLSLEMDNFKMIVEPYLDPQCDTLFGTIMIKTIGNSFNHASCQSELVITKIVEEERFIHIEIQMDYHVDLLKHIMTIDFVPKVIV